MNDPEIAPPAWLSSRLIDIVFFGSLAIFVLAMTFGPRIGIAVLYAMDRHEGLE